MKNPVPPPFPAHCPKETRPPRHSSSFHLHPAMSTCFPAYPGSNNIVSHLHGGAIPTLCHHTLGSDAHLSDSASFSSCSKLSPRAKGSKMLRIPSQLCSTKEVKQKSNATALVYTSGTSGHFRTAKQRSFRVHSALLLPSHTSNWQRTKWRGHGVSCNKTEPQSSDTHFFTTALQQFPVLQNSS